MLRALAAFGDYLCMAPAPIHDPQPSLTPNQGDPMLPYCVWIAGT